MLTPDGNGTFLANGPLFMRRLKSKASNIHHHVGSTLDQLGGQLLGRLARISQRFGIKLLDQIVVQVRCNGALAEPWSKPHGSGPFVQSLGTVVPSEGIRVGPGTVRRLTTARRSQVGVLLVLERWKGVSKRD
uniref:Uncharacterized protein n=1 Tax=Anopheles merus TaxID=30066 RepID=A0A182VKB8_ANOME